MKTEKIMEGWVPAEETESEFLEWLEPIEFILATKKKAEEQWGSVKLLRVKVEIEEIERIDHGRYNDGKRSEDDERDWKSDYSEKSDSHSSSKYEDVKKKSQRQTLRSPSPRKSVQPENVSSGVQGTGSEHVADSGLSPGRNNDRKHRDRHPRRKSVSAPKKGNTSDS